MLPVVSVVVFVQPLKTAGNVAWLVDGSSERCISRIEPGTGDSYQKHRHSDVKHTSASRLFAVCFLFHAWSVTAVTQNRKTLVAGARETQVTSVCITQYGAWPEVPIRL